MRGEQSDLDKHSEYSSTGRTEMSFRNKARIIRGVLVLSASIGALAEANAQSSDPFKNPMPATFSIDQNGVDLVNWSFSYAVAPISIGAADQDPLQSSIFIPTNRDGFTSNLRIQDPSNATSTRASASVGSKSWSFISGGGVSDPGAQVIVFTDSAEVIARDGTQIIYQFPSWYTPGVVGPVNFCATKIVKPAGETLTFYNEDEPSGVRCRTRSIVSNRGYQVRYEYNSSTWSSFRTKITLINNAYEYCDPAATSCSLSMNWPSVSISVAGDGSTTYTDNTGRTWVNGSGGLLSPGETTPGINWTTETYITPSIYVGQVDWRVTGVTKHGKTWVYSYPSNDSVLGGGALDLIRVQDPLGGIKRFRRVQALSSGDVNTGEFESPNLAYKALDELGKETDYNYTAQALILNITPPEGNVHAATYDPRGNMLTSTLKAKPGSGIADATTTYTYGAFNDKPLTVKDANGHITIYAYDALHRFVLKETDPAPSSTAAQPVKRYSYSPHYAWVKNGSGGYVQAASPVWLLDSERTCRTSATTTSSVCTAGASDEIVTTYNYGSNSGPNNLLLAAKTVAAGDGSVSATTTYGYDAVGNVTVIDGPRSDVDDRRYFTYDGSRRKVFEIGSDPDGVGVLPRPIVRHVYDAEGNEVRTEYGTGNATDGSDFVVSRFMRMTYDLVTHQPIKSEEVLP